MLSADAFSAFEEVGLDNTEAVAAKGRSFRDTVLSLGGGRAPALVFKVPNLAPFANDASSDCTHHAASPGGRAPALVFKVTTLALSTSSPLQTTCIMQLVRARARVQGARSGALKPHTAPTLAPFEEHTTSHRMHHAACPGSLGGMACSWVCRALLSVGLFAGCACTIIAPGQIAGCSSNSAES